MDAIRATAAPIATAASTAAGTSTTDPSSTSTSAKADAEKSFATLFAEAKQDLKSGEKLTKVAGHEFARIKGGSRDDMCVNLSGNARNGQAFDLIWRDGRQFHVYGGKGADHKVVEVGHKAAATTKSSDSTTTDASSGGTSAAGTTTTTSGSASTASPTTATSSAGAASAGS